MNNEELVKDYILSGNQQWRIVSIDTIRDGGTYCIYLNTDSKLYIHQTHSTIHTNYPPTMNNLLTHEPTKAYLLDKLNRYLENCQIRVKQTENIINKLNQNKDGSRRNRKNCT